MSKSENQKKKLLYILKFFYEETDEEHTLTVNKIIAKLERNGISAARWAIYDDIRTIQDFGVDIVMRKSKTCEYFLASRLFEMAELLLHQLTLKLFWNCILILGLNAPFLNKRKKSDSRFNWYHNSTKNFQISSSNSTYNNVLQ